MTYMSGAQAVSARDLDFEYQSGVIMQSIRAVCKNSPNGIKFEDVIRFAQGPSFKDRIEELVVRLKAEHAQALLGDPIEFEQTLRQTRNFFTHLGIKQQSRVLSDAKELFSFNQKVSAFLRLLMLKDVGFSEDTVFNAIQHQAKKWVLF